MALRRRDECTCACHRSAGMIHMVACCQPSEEESAAIRKYLGEETPADIVREISANFAKQLAGIMNPTEEPAAMTNEYKRPEPLDVVDDQEQDLTMRAKIHVTAVIPASEGSVGETLHFGAIAANSYPADGSDENNTFAKYTPSLELKIYIANPALIGKFGVGDTFYLDWTPATK